MVGSKRSISLFRPVHCFRICGSLFFFPSVVVFFFAFLLQQSLTCCLTSPIFTAFDSKHAAQTCNEFRSEPLSPRTHIFSMSPHLSCYPCYKRILCDFIFRRTFLALFSSRFVETKYPFENLRCFRLYDRSPPSHLVNFLSSAVLFCFFSFWMTTHTWEIFTCAKNPYFVLFSSVAVFFLVLFAFSFVFFIVCLFVFLFFFFFALLVRPLSLQFSCSLKWARGNSLHGTNHHD